MSFSTYNGIIISYFSNDYDKLITSVPIDFDVINSVPTYYDIIVNSISSDYDIRILLFSPIMTPHLVLFPLIMTSEIVFFFFFSPPIMAPLLVLFPMIITWEYLFYWLWHQNLFFFHCLWCHNSVLSDYDMRNSYFPTDYNIRMTFYFRILLF